MTRYELNKAIDKIMEMIDAIPNRIHMDAEIEPIQEELDALRGQLMDEGING